MSKRTKRNQIQHQPVNFAPTNSLSGINNTFFPKKRKERSDTSASIVYEIVFVKRFDNVTTTDVKMQKKYALNLISEALGLKEKYLKLTQKGKMNKSILHTDRVYYVHRGKKLIGKCSIREQRTFSETHLIFIYKTRRYVSKKKEE